MIQYWFIRRGLGFWLAVNATYQLCSVFDKSRRTRHDMVRFDLVDVFNFV